jgi:predicted O-linked N-acetylglucosamine transferase (SPINDLY family)
VTWRGETFAGRVVASLLTAVGLQELIASNVDGYVEHAIELAADRAKLTTYRGYLLDTGRMSALFDVASTARALETAYQRMAAQFRSATRSPIVIGAEGS